MTAAALAITIFMVIRLGPIIQAIFWSLVIAYLLSPLHRAIGKMLPGKRALALTFLIFLLCIMALPALIIPILFRDVAEIMTQIPAVFSRIDQWMMSIESALSPYLNLRMNTQALQLISDRITAWLSEWLRDGNGLVSLSDSLVWIILIPIISFYMLKDREKAIRAIKYLIPQKHRSAILSAAHSTNRMLRQFLKGQLLVSGIVGLLTALGLWAAGVKYPLILGIFTSLCNLIPYIGSLVAVVPVLLLSFMGGTVMLMKSLLVVIIVQQMESLVISPRIMGVNLGIHPAIVLLSVLTGGTLAGITGFLLALPIVILIKGILQFIQQRWILQKRSIEDCKFFDE